MRLFPFGQMSTRPQVPASTIIDRLATKILGSPIAQLAARELEEERLAAHRALTARLRALDVQDLAAHQTAARDLAAAREDVEQQQIALEQARARYTVVDRAAWLASGDIAHQRTLTEKALLDLASPAIDAFILTLRAVATETVGVLHASSATNPLTDAVNTWSNWESGKERLAAIQAAIAEAETLKFVALTEAELAARLELLREAIPEVGPRVRTVAMPRKRPYWATEAR